MTEKFVMTDADYMYRDMQTAAYMKDVAEHMAPDLSPVDCLPVGAAYVPYQKFRDIYEPDVALSRGTIFSELDKPFLGKRVME